jgi:hypothetical protein
METLGNVLGAPLRTITLSADRKIHWFQIQDGLLGIESPAQIIHFRPNSSRLLNDLPARYGPPSARYVVNDEVINNYSTASQLALTTLAPSSQEKAIKEVMLWRIETFWNARFRKNENESVDLKLEEVPTLVTFVNQIMHRTTPSTLKALAPSAATPHPAS